MQKLQSPGGNSSLASFFDVKDRTHEIFVAEDDAVEVGEVELVSGGAGGYGKSETVFGEDLVKDLNGYLFDGFDYLGSGHFADGDNVDIFGRKFIGGSGGS